MSGRSSKSKPANQAAWVRRYGYLLGRISDEQLARKVGITRTAVGSMRRRLGIPSASLATREHEWPKHIIQQLGTVPDRC